LQLAIPNNEEIKDKIILPCHDSLCAGHLGKTKTYDLVADSSGGPVLEMMSIDIASYVTHAKG
jgi:hypothetical protein